MLNASGNWACPDDLIARIVAADCSWVGPTPAFHYHSVTQPPADMTAERLAELKARRAARTVAFRKLLDAGQRRWIVGSDIGGTNPPDTLPIACRLMVTEIGMTHRSALRAATSDAARALGAFDRIGSLAVGKIADVVVVDGDPLEDIAAISRVKKVIVRGRELEDLPGSN